MGLLRRYLCWIFFIIIIIIIYMMQKPESVKKHILEYRSTDILFFRVFPFTFEG